MTGDNEIAAQPKWLKLGIDEYHARCLPRDKLEKVKALQAEGGWLLWLETVSMMPLHLAQANIGISMDSERISL
ncbi:MAG: hypothetical protein R2780_00930 [Crocinitomicaceae bacterium]